MHRLLLSAALLAGCGGAVCPETRGVCVAGYHGDPAELDAVLQAAEPLGIDGAHLWFMSPVDSRYCLTERKVHGCYRADWDIAFVDSTNVVEHELRHRAQWFADGVLDVNHSDPRWWGTE